MAKHAIALPLVTALAFPLTAAAQQAFEGTVTYEMKADGGQTMEMVHHVKGNDIRIDMNMNNQSVSIITDHGGTKQIMLMHQQKQWIDAKAMMDRMAGMPGMPSASAGEKKVKPPEDLNIRATGNRETIAGHECEHYIFSSDGHEVDICAAKGLGWYFGVPASGGMMGMGRGRGMGAEAPGVPGVSNAQLEQWQKLYADGFFPLKMTVSGGGGVTLTVTELTKKKLEPSVFRAPSDYKQMGG